jgi:large subunit ribosomal protein L25
VISSVKLGPISVSLPRKTVEKLVQNSRFFALIHEVEVEVNTKVEKIKVIPIGIDFHPVNNSVLHVDFAHVLGDTVMAQVPVKIVGADKSPGLKKGGKLNLVKYHVPLKCDTNNIPEAVEVNVASFGVGRSLFLSSIKLQAGAEMAYDCLVLSITGRGKKDKAESAGQTSAETK